MNKEEGVKKISCTLRVGRSNRDVFCALRDGKKKIETRAGTTKYRNLKKGDFVKIVCGDESFIRKIVSVEYFPSIRAILREYKPSDIIPTLSTERELRDCYHSFNGYTEKLKRFGLVAWKLK